MRPPAGGPAVPLGPADSSPRPGCPDPPPGPLPLAWDTLLRRWVPSLPWNLAPQTRPHPPGLASLPPLCQTHSLREHFLNLGVPSPAPTSLKLALPFFQLPPRFFWMTPAASPLDFPSLIFLLSNPHPSWPLEGVLPKLSAVPLCCLKPLHPISHLPPEALHLPQ